jgi:hypothetical protein
MAAARGARAAASRPSRLREGRIIRATTGLLLEREPHAPKKEASPTRQAVFAPEGAGHRRAARGGRHPGLCPGLSGRSKTPARK